VRAQEKETEIEPLYAELLRIGENSAGVRDWFDAHDPSESTLLTLLRRAIPQRFLEFVATMRPWCDRAVLLGAVVMNPKAPRHLARRIVSSLGWLDLARVAATPRLDAAIRWSSEEILCDRIADMRLGERITLAKISTARILARLLLDADSKVVDAALLNQRLREADVLAIIRGENPPRTFLERVTECYRWRDNHAVRLALVLQPRTPLAVALAQMSRLLDAELRDIATAANLRPLLRASADRIRDERKAQK
jgi:hypothetical protein